MDPEDFLSKSLTLTRSCRVCMVLLLQAAFVFCFFYKLPRIALLFLSLALLFLIAFRLFVLIFKSNLIKYNDIFYFINPKVNKPDFDAMFVKVINMLRRYVLKIQFTLFSINNCIASLVTNYIKNVYYFSQ